MVPIQYTTSAVEFSHLSEKIRNINCDQGCKGNSIRRSQVKVVEGGFPRISARGYIIISNVKI